MREQRSLLETLWETQVLTLGQITELFYGEDSRACYEDIRDLTERKLIISRQRPGNRNEKYAMLAPEGIRGVQYGKSTSAPATVIPNERVEVMLVNNKVYVAARKAGIEKERLKARRAALKSLGLAPHHTMMAWLLKADTGDYMLYPRRDRLRKRLLDSAERASGKVKGHIIFYDDENVQSRDAKFYTGKSCPPNFHVMQYKEKAKLRSLTYASEAPIHKMVRYMAMLAPNGNVKHLPADAPFEHAWETEDSQGLLVDLSTGNLGNVNTLKAINWEYLVQNWGERVVVFVENQRSLAGVVEKLIGPREWMWVIRLDAPLEQSLYRWNEFEGLVPVQPISN